MQVWPLGQEDALEKGMATHPSILAWRITWTEEPGRLQSKELDMTEHTQHAKDYIVYPQFVTVGHQLICNTSYTM